MTMHRALNYIATKAGNLPRLLKTMKHFNLNDAAGELLEKLSEEVWDDKHTAVVTSPSHPFDGYTISFITNSDAYGPEEILIVVTKQNGEFRTGMTSMPLSKDRTVGSAMRLLTREEAFNPPPPDVPHPELASLKAKSMWLLVDAFRVMLAQPQDVTATQGRYEKTTNEKLEKVIRYQPGEITISLDAIKRYGLRSGTPTGRTVGEHPYRGHYCHRGLDPNCDHNWVPHVSSTPEHGRWECAGCGAKRWDRKGGTRGDPSKPVTPKIYKIKKGA
jgi:hypothetical protein